MLKPLVTIGMPVFNMEAFLPSAIESVLGQALGDFVLVVSDNASTDGTEEICRDFLRRDRRVRYYRQDRNYGAARNCNFVARTAETKYFAWHAADDLSHPQFLERCCNILEGNDEVVLAYAIAGTIDEDGVRGERPAPALDVESADRVRRFRSLLTSIPYAENITYGVMRSAALRRTRLEGEFSGGDRAFSAELALYGPFRRVPEVLFWRRTRRSDRSERESHVYDTGRASGWGFREWRIIRHNLESVARAPLPVDEKARLYTTLLRTAVVRRKVYLYEIGAGINRALG